MKPAVEARVLRRTEAPPGKVLWTVELDGETYVAVVEGGVLGVVLVVRTHRECRKTKVRWAIEAIVKGG